MTNPESCSLLLIHGRDFKPSVDAWLDLSLQALRRGIERDYPDVVTKFDAIDKHHAWYGDLNNELLAAAGKTYDEQLDVGDRRNVLAELSKIEARKKFGIRHYDSLPGKSAVPEFVADIGAPMLGAIGLTMPVLSLMSKDFASYLKGDTDYAEQVRSRVRERIVGLFEKGDRILLLTHGTGSAVAYDVLWQLSHDRQYRSKYEGAKIDTWITMGSPLGDSSIRKRLNGAREKLAARFPNNVISWHNVSAEDDYTCHDNTLADDFKKMMAYRVVSAVSDYQIYNLAVRYGKSNPHSSLGYLIHPRVSKIVADWLCADISLGTP